MSEGRSPVRSIVSLLLIALTVLGLINVYGDNTETRRLAEETACGKPGCAVQMTAMSRNPLGQSFTFQTAMTAPGASVASVDVECQKAMIFVGEVSCEKK